MAQSIVWIDSRYGSGCTAELPLASVEIYQEVRSQSDKTPRLYSVKINGRDVVPSKGRTLPATLGEAQAWAVAVIKARAAKLAEFLS